jgi:uncharacterized protein (TIGR00369 family)
MTRDYTRRSRGCFGCGSDNAAGLGLEPFREDGQVFAEFTPAERHRGFSSVVHGGIIATALDEILTNAASSALGRLAATSSLEVRFLRPLAVGQTYRVRGRYLGLVDGQHAAEGDVTGPNGVTLATARGRFVELTPERVERFVKKI